MAATSENKPKQYISVGILAHVDAGKTTLSEGILYLTGQIRKLGRVDHGDAFLDMYTLERSRGITIFSKQANFVLGDKQVTLLDTPGLWTFQQKWSVPCKFLIMQSWLSAERTVCRDIHELCGIFLQGIRFRPLFS